MDVADLVELVAEFVRDHGAGQSRAVEQLRKTLNRLIDDRVARRAEVTLTRDTRTQGRRIADATITTRPDNDGAVNHAEVMRYVLADAIDKAIADEREACARTVEATRARVLVGNETSGPIVYAIDPAKAIRDRK